MAVGEAVIPTGQPSTQRLSIGGESRGASGTGMPGLRFSYTGKRVRLAAAATRQGASAAVAA